METFLGGPVTALWCVTAPKLFQGFDFSWYFGHAELILTQNLSVIMSVLYKAQNELHHVSETVHRVYKAVT
jgi:hypothetical protein